jgi:hypothetical protein
MARGHLDLIRGSLDQIGGFGREAIKNLKDQARV